MEMQPGFTLWLTGLSGAGKSTLARYIASRLPLIGRRVELLDGPEVEGLFPEVPRASAREQLEHSTRALGWAARLLTRNGVIAIVTSLSPYKEAREEVRKAIGRFVEVMVDAPFEQLEARDHRGFYKQGMAGEITDLIGFHEPYETNTHPEIKVDTGTTEDEEVLGRQVFERLFSHGFLSRKERDVLINGGTLDLEEDDEPEAELDAEEARAELIERRVAAEAAARAAAEAPAAAVEVVPAPKTVKAPKAARVAAKAEAPAKAVKAPKAKAGQVVEAAPEPAAPKAPAKAKAPKAAAAAKGEKAAAKAEAPAKAAKAPKAKAAQVAEAAPETAAPKAAAKAKAPKAAATRGVKAEKPAKAARPAKAEKPAKPARSKPAKAEKATPAKPARAAKPAAAKTVAPARAARVAKPARAAAKPAKAAPARSARGRR